MGTATGQAGRELGDGVEPSGAILATFDRRGRGGGREQVRVSLDEFEGKKYIGARVWYLSDGRWFPSKSGFTIRVHELQPWIEALTEAQDAIEGEATPEARPQATRAQSRPSKPVNPVDRPLLSYAPGAAGFDEFGEGER